MTCDDCRHARHTGRCHAIVDTDDEQFDCACRGPRPGVVHTTPWSRAALKALRDPDGLPLWDDRRIAALAAALPDGANLHISGKSTRGPFYVRLYLDGREVSPMNEYGGVAEYHDLGSAIGYVLAGAGIVFEGVGSAS